jgi:hypothetical protein
MSLSVQNATGLVMAKILHMENFLESYIAEFLCPKCFETIAFVQFPMKEEVKKWEAENPGKKTGWEE